MYSSYPPSLSVFLVYLQGSRKKPLSFATKVSQVQLFQRTACILFCMSFKYTAHLCDEIRAPLFPHHYESSRLFSPDPMHEMYSNNERESKLFVTDHY